MSMISEKLKLAIKEKGPENKGKLKRQQAYYHRLSSKGIA